MQHGRYTITRFNRTHIEVTAKGAPARMLFAPEGTTATPSCNCPKYGACGHQEAAVVFLNAEAQPKAQQKAAQSLEDLFAW
jgi:uncharacterized Zn finger protein